MGDCILQTVELSTNDFLSYLALQPILSFFVSSSLKLELKMTDEFKVSGGNRYDAIQKKIDAGKKITLQEMQVMNLPTCSAVRDKYWPAFCVKQGLPKDIKLTYIVWSAIWDACMTQYHLEVNGKKNGF